MGIQLSSPTFSSVFCPSNRSFKNGQSFFFLLLLFLFSMRYTPSISKEVSLSFLSNCRHGTQNWRDLQRRGLKPVYGSMGLQAFFHQLDRIWGHTGAGSLRYCFILYIFYLSLTKFVCYLKEE